MLHLFRGEITIDQLWNMTYKEIRYLRDLRVERKKKNGGADEAAGMIATLLTGGKAP